MRPRKSIGVGILIVVQATGDLKDALEDINKVQDILASVTKVLTVVGKVVPLL